MDSRSMTLAEEKETGRSTSPSPAASLRKETKAEMEDEKTDNENESIENGTNTDGENAEEYPDGMRMAFIVIALLLSIFLVSSSQPRQCSAAKVNVSR